MQKCHRHATARDGALVLHVYANDASDAEIVREVLEELRLRTTMRNITHVQMQRIRYASGHLLKRQQLNKLY